MLTKYASSVFENAPDAIFIHDLNGKILDANQKACTSLQLTKQEVLSMPITELEVNFLKLEDLQAIWDKMEYEKTARVFGRHQRKDGSSFPVEVHIAKHKTEDGDIVVAFASDISHREQLENELEDSKSRLAFTESVADLGSWKYDLITEKLTWSEGVYKMFQLDPDSFDLTLESFMAILPEEDKQRLTDAYNLSLETGEPYEEVHGAFMPNGELRYFKESGVTQYDEEGTPLISTGTVQDISLSIKAKEELIKSKEKLALATAHEQIGIWDWELKKDQMHFDSNFARLIGQENMQDHFKFDQWLDLVYPQDREKVRQQMDLASKSSEQFNLEYRLGNPMNGQLFYVQSIGQVAFSEQGRPVRMTGLLIDETQRKEAELALKETQNRFQQELQEQVDFQTKELLEARHRLSTALTKEQELNKLKSKFISIASHQFRTPLTIIQGNMDMLKEVSSEMRSEYIDVSKVFNSIQDQIDFIVELINDVLTHEKVRSENSQVEIQTADLCAVVRDTIDSINSSSMAGRSIKLDLPDEPLWVRIDPKLTKHSLFNVLSNALKYSIGHPDPQVVVLGSDLNASVEVIDHGIGIPADEMDDIFQPFYRASNVTGLSGSGFGLNLAKEYVELMNGSLEIASEEGKGTQCKITLSLSQEGN